MKLNIKYSCGHEGTIEVFGKAEERERKIKYFEEYGLCPDCYKAEKKTEEKAFAEGHELPELKGSEKQISWANKIRKELIEKFEKEKTAIRKGAGDDFADFSMALSNPTIGKILHLGGLTTENGEHLKKIY